MPLSLATRVSRVFLPPVRRLVAIAIGVGFLACALPPAVAEATIYPPGPGPCTDTLLITQLQDTEAGCHPFVPDTVLGVRGIITAMDTKPTGFGFYIQNTSGISPTPYSGILVFTGAFNYAASVPGTPTGGNLVLGDSVVVYGKMQEFAGETEIEGLDASQATNDVLIRRITGGIGLPPAHVGTTANLNFLASISATTAEPWEGCLVRVNAPLQVARTQTGAGVAPNTFLVVNPSSPGDSILVDGFTIATISAPPLGTDLNFVQGILNQRIINGISVYRIQLRDPNDYEVYAPPTLVDAYPIEDDKLRLIFDKNLDEASAEDEGNYALGSLSNVDLATLVGGAGYTVELDITSTLSDGDQELIVVQNIASSACPSCPCDPHWLLFYNGVMTVSMIQQPDPAYLSPCEDRSRFAGAGAAAGDRLTVRGVAVQNYGSLYYLVDAAGGPRTGVSVFAPSAPLIAGRQYRIAGRVQEFQGETEIVLTSDILDEGPAAVPSPFAATVAALRDTACDSGMSVTTGEDYEGVLVRVQNATVVQSSAAPYDPPPGGAFRIVHSAGAPDTILVHNLSGYYSFDADLGAVVDVTGLLHFAFGEFRILPRSDTDITLLAHMQPLRGGDDGSVSATISGFGFQNGTTARLVRSGESDITGTSTTVASDTRSMTATFDLVGAALGVWDVVVDRPGGFADTLVAAFTVEGSAAQELRADVVGPTQIRPNRRKAFDIVLENLGNGDVLNVPLWISRIPADATVELDFPLTYPPQGGGEPDWSTVPLTLGGPAGKYLALVIPRLPPGTTVRRIYLTVPNPVTSFTLDAALTPPWADGGVFLDCLSGGGVITAPACVGTQLDASEAYLAATPSAQALSGIGLWAKIAWQCEGAASLPAALAEAEQALDFMLQPVEGTAVPSDCEVALVPRWQDRRFVAIVTSVDPNDKLGVGGAGAGRLIGSDQLLAYSIRFENLESATAPAQEVVVLDPLDAARLDLSTLSLGPITFGDKAIYPPPGLSSYSVDVDLRPAQELIVRIGAGLDLGTGVLSWSFVSIDPVTGDLPEDPQVGFLPPNVTPPQGDGSVLFTVMPKPGLTGGMSISNQATIVFDGVPLATPPWTNTMDTTPPESHVLLPGGANTDSATFTVSWAAVGTQPDLRDFSVYVSENSGAFRPWRLHTTATADTIAAPGGRTYSFYSLARDSSGNLEPVPLNPDVQTFSRVAVDERVPARLALEGAAPNPAMGEARVWFTLPNRERAVLEVMDVAGRRVLRREVGQLGPGRHAVDVSAATRRPGLYFLRLAQGDREHRARMVVVR